MTREPQPAPDRRELSEKEPDAPVDLPGTVRVAAAELVVEHDRTSVVGQGFQRFEAFVRKARLPVQRQDGLPDAVSPTTR